MNVFGIHVHVTDESHSLVDTYLALYWLDERGYRIHQDYLVNMHGGRFQYSTFSFKYHRVATEFKLRWG
jgi:hypothetical protein